MNEKTHYDRKKHYGEYSMQCPFCMKEMKISFLEFGEECQFQCENCLAAGPKFNSVEEAVKFADIYESKI